MTMPAGWGQNNNPRKSKKGAGAGLVIAIIVIVIASVWYYNRTQITSPEEQRYNNALNNYVDACYNGLAQGNSFVISACDNRLMDEAEQACASTTKYDICKDGRVVDWYNH